MARTTNRDDAASARKADAESAGQNPNQRLIEALRVEREGYVRRGLDGRVKQVDAQIKHYGGSSVEADAKAAAEKAGDAGSAATATK